MADTEQELQVKVAEAVGLTEPTEPDDHSGDVRKITEGGEDSSYVALQKYYGVEPEDVSDKVKTQLLDIWEYFKTQDDVKDSGDILKAVRAAHMNMVQPEIGQTKLSQLADYVRLLRNINDQKKQKEAYERLRPR